jgi:asparagine synthase (glutamine-hydrolysing)
MCGICGQYNFDKKPIDLQFIKKMAHTLVHRGPDDQGFYVNDNVGLGFRRLSIIDTEGGHQPMSDGENTVFVVFNGEIYNFFDLRKELESCGHTFRTKSDTEVIIYGYKQWGIDVLNHLNGMFGLAIWDNQNQKLLLARDRMGIKPLYYTIENGYLIFASEIRAITACDKRKVEIDPLALNLFLRYRYCPSPLTIINNVKKLAPGTLLIVENGETRIKRWWNFHPAPFDPMPSLKDAQDKLLELYRSAVKRQLISDVPLGLLLSGGVDSALLLALMNENGANWKTFSIGYGHNFKDDEIKDAQKSADFFKSDHASIEINQDTFVDSLEKIVSYLEEPVATSSIVPMYHLCHRASQDVKTALIGQGPDELLGGYARHIGVYYGNYWRSIPPGFRNSIKFLLNKIPRSESLKRGIYSLDVPDRFKRYREVFSIMPGEVIDGLFHDGILAGNTNDTLFESWADLMPLMTDTDELGGLNFIEIRSTLPDELLMYADKLSMAHSLELRVPYLDQEIVEYVERLNASFKIHNFKGKYLHKSVSRELLPSSIINRKKRGFAHNVVDDWFKNIKGGGIEEVLLSESSAIYKYLQPRKTKKILDDHKCGKNNNYKILFSLVVLEKCLNNYRI